MIASGGLCARRAGPHSGIRMPARRPAHHARPHKTDWDGDKQRQRSYNDCPSQRNVGSEEESVADPAPQRHHERLEDNQARNNPDIEEKQRPECVRCPAVPSTTHGATTIPPAEDRSEHEANRRSDDESRGGGHRRDHEQDRDRQERGIEREGEQGADEAWIPRSRLDRHASPRSREPGPRNTLRRPLHRQDDNVLLITITLLLAASMSTPAGAS